MKRKLLSKRGISALVTLLLSVIWTVTAGVADVSAIGPMGSPVGLSTLNAAVRDLVGVRMELYELTDILGLVPIAVALGYAIVGAAELIGGRSLWRVDRRILALGGLYIALGVVFVGFELIPLNYRPVLIEGVLEASYPSSTTLLVMTVIPAFLIDVATRVKKKRIFWVIFTVSAAFCAFVVAARILSGVHWFSDIVGGLLISATLVLSYSALMPRE